MQTKVSAKRQVVLPSPLRRLNVRAGDRLEANIDDGRIVLTSRRERPQQVKLVTDSVTGLPALRAGPSAELSSKEVGKILADFA